MGLLDGGGAALLHNVFRGVFVDATLYRRALTDNGKGGLVADDGDGEPCKAQRARTTEAMRSRDGYADTDMRILVLSEGIDPITSDHKILFEGQLWSIANVSRDPAGAYFDLHGRKA